MYLERFISKEEMQKIKENKQREKEVSHYQFEAVGRMTRLESGYRMKNYKDKY